MPDSRYDHVEGKSHRELDSTFIGRKTARFLSWAFIFFIVSVPLFQAAVELRQQGKIQVLEVFVSAGKTIPLLRAHKNAEAWALMRETIAPQSLKSYEQRIEKQSVVKNVIQARMQSLLTRLLGTGNEKVVLGRNGWLFLRGGVDYLTGPSFLDEGFLQLRTSRFVNSLERGLMQPDPRGAIAGLSSACERAGIHLVVVPVPDKAMLQASYLSRRFDEGRRDADVNNEGFSSFLGQMKSAGVDLYEIKANSANSDEPRFLIQDTHWTPAFMAGVARGLSQHILAKGNLPPIAAKPSYGLREARVSQLGDLVSMLMLPEPQTIFSPQQVIVQQVFDSHTGKIWEAREDADVLLLGDSFTNIYSDRSLGWGSGAGFAEHLSYCLQRPLDVIAINGGGASATRKELARTENSNRVSRKRLIIYQFSMRDLSMENWVSSSLPPGIAGPAPESPKQNPSITNGMRAPSATTESTALPEEPKTRKVDKESNVGVPAPARKASSLDSAHQSPLSAEASSAKSGPTAAAVAPQVRAADTGELILTGRIVKTSDVPKPETAPYRDCLTYIKFEVEHVESGTYDKREIIAVFVAMRDRVWLPAAQYATGDRLWLKLIPLRRADSSIRVMQRADNLDDFDLQPFFSLEAIKQ